MHPNFESGLLRTLVQSLKRIKLLKLQTIHYFFTFRVITIDITTVPTCRPDIIFRIYSHPVGNAFIFWGDYVYLLVAKITSGADRNRNDR